MNKKITSVFALFAMVIFSLTLVSADADLTITPTSIPTEVAHNAGSFVIQFTLQNADESTTIDWTGSSATQGATISVPATTIANGQTSNLQATITFPEHTLGTISGTISADPTVGGDTKTFPFSVNILESASLVINQKTALSETQNGVYTLENTGNKALNSIDLTVTGDFLATLSPTSISTLTAGSTSSDITLTSSDLDDLDFGDNKVTITAEASDGTIATSEVSIRNTFCKEGGVGGNLQIDVEIDNKGEGDDDEFHYLDEVEVEVEITNDGNDEIDDIVAELGFFDSDGRNVADDLEFLNTDEEEIEVGDLDEDDDEKVTFRFKVPADMDDGNYKLAVKAYSDDLGEDEECVDDSNDLSNSFYESVSIERETDEERFIVVDDILVDEQLACGDVLSGSFTVYNIGDEDQERVQIVMTDTSLGVEQVFDILDDLDEGKDEDFTFSLPIPLDAQEGSHTLRFKTFYDYNRGSFREESEDTFVATYNLIGCSGTVPIGGTTSVQVSASLESEAKSGEDLIVKTSLTNTGDEVLTINVDAENFNSWAVLNSVSPSTLTLNPGQTGTATMTFTVDEDASGTQSFVIEARNSATGGILQVRDVEVNIDGGITSSGLSGSGLIWVIGIVNVILIVLIVVVAVRLSRR